MAEKVTSFVLAGGRSSRMGADKRFLRLGGRMLIEHAVGIARATGENVRIIGGGPELAEFASRAGLELVSDQFPGCGPLAGIHAALESTETELNFILAVDTPFLPPAFADFLRARAGSRSSVAFVAQAGPGLHPLSALYRRGFLPVAREALAKGSCKIDALFPQVDTDIISEQELAQAGFSPLIFDNINNQEDFVRARRRFAF